MALCKLNKLITQDGQRAALNILESYLKDLGLTECEIKLYIYLATAKPQTVKDISNSSGLSKNVVKNYLNKLKAKDLVEVNSSSPITYKAMEIQTLLNLIELKINLEIQILEKILKNLDNLNPE